MNCPECDAFMHTEKCRSCGWSRPAEKAKAVEWAPAEVEPPTPEQMAEVRELIRQTSEMLGVAKVERPAKLYQAIPRCPQCEVGPFVHRGTRYCVTCYGKL